MTVAREDHDAVAHRLELTVTTRLAEVDNTALAESILTALAGLSSEHLMPEVDVTFDSLTPIESRPVGVVHRVWFIDGGLGAGRDPSGILETLHLAVEDTDIRIGDTLLTYKEDGEPSTPFVVESFGSAPSLAGRYTTTRNPAGYERRWVVASDVNAPKRRMFERLQADRADRAHGQRG